MTQTPLMKQYTEMKRKHPDAVLLFRIGDFYECFSVDAVTCSQILGITLTRRSNGSKPPIELAGFPHHALDTYLPKLVRAGKRVAICEQLEQPKRKTEPKEVILPGKTKEQLKREQEEWERTVRLQALANAFCTFLTQFVDIVDKLRRWEEIKRHTQAIHELSQGLHITPKRAFDEAFKALIALLQPALFDCCEPTQGYGTIPQIKLSYVSDSKQRAKPAIKAAKDTADIIRASYDEGEIELREYFKAVYLTQSNKILGIQTISMGGLSSTMVDAKLIFKGALLSNAASVIITHNHPGGQLKPSAQDDKLTREIAEGCKTLSLRLLDHIIVTVDSYYSYNDEGRLHF